MLFIVNNNQLCDELNEGAERLTHHSKTYPQLSINKNMCYNSLMPRRTYQPKKIKRNRTHGFRARMQEKSGHILKKRRLKGRQKLTV